MTDLAAYVHDVAPIRVVLILVGGFAGMLAVAGSVWFLRLGQPTFGREDEVVTALSLPVLAVVPRMTSALERRNRNQRRRMLWAVALIVVASCLAAVWWRLQS